MFLTAESLGILKSCKTRNCLKCPDLKRSPRDEASRAEIWKERLRTLKMGALAMARAVVPKGSGESVNHHPDYEFFLSRCG
nr:unnamed protein product [Digitaria exilis]